MDPLAALALIRSRPPHWDLAPDGPLALIVRKTTRGAALTLVEQDVEAIRQSVAG